MADKIAVIVPYYQEQPGILRRALASVAAQEGVDGVEVVVVDDGSPVPAAEELESAPASASPEVRVLRQGNAGPGAARNAALDALSRETGYVAFLDSDDEWLPGHLSRALSALERGYDFYFADFYRIDQQTSDFELPPRFVPAADAALAGLADVYEYRSDLFRQQILRSIIHASTVAYRRSRLEHLRFCAKLTHASEDRLFWLDAAAAKPRVAFSSRPACRLGRGTNVFHGRRWGTRHALESYASELRFCKIFENRYALDDELAPVIERKRHLARRNFATSVLHMIRHGRGLEPLFLMQQLGRDPLLLPTCLFEAGRIALRKLGYAGADSRP